MKSIIRSYPLCTLLLLAACNPSSESAGPTKRTAELAEKLVTCENERNDLRDKLGTSMSELTQLKTAPKPTGLNGDGPAIRNPADAPGPAGSTAARAGRAAPRKPAGLGHELRATGPRATGPENPEAEAREANLVAQALKSHVGEFRPCYERGLKRNSNLQFINQVKIRVTIAPDGRAQDIHITPKTDSDMESCIGQVVSHWPFPAYRGQPVVLEVPVNLKIQGQ